MEKRTTIYNIAENLGISTTTVYRALNDKPKISAETKSAVLRAAEEMGFKANTLARSLARKPIRLAVVGFTSFPEFHNQCLDGARQTQEELRDYNIIVDYFSYENGESISHKATKYLSDRLQYIRREHYDGALIIGKQVDDYADLKSSNIPVAVAVNDIQRNMRTFCIQYDGYVAGKIAAELMSWRLAENSKVVVASGSPDFGIHTETFNGFIDQAKITPLDVLPVYYHYDNTELAFTNTNEMLRKYPDVRGIYVNTYNSSGVIRSVIEHGLAKKICILTSDINAELRAYIDEGIVSASIFQDQYTQGRLALRYLYQYITEDLKVEDTIRIKPQVLFKSNMNLYD